MEQLGKKVISSKLFLKSHDANVPLNYFLSYLILYFYVFILFYFFCVFDERDIKIKQNYIFRYVFNRCELHI